MHFQPRILHFEKKNIYQQGNAFWQTPSLPYHDATGQTSEMDGIGTLKSGVLYIYIK